MRDNRLHRTAMKPAGCYSKRFSRHSDNRPRGTITSAAIWALREYNTPSVMPPTHAATRDDEELLIYDWTSTEQRLQASSLHTPIL